MLYANWTTPNPTPPPDLPSVVPPGGEVRADLGRAASPLYTGYKTSKDISAAKLLEAVRRLHPGRPLICHASFAAEIGDAPDLQIHRWLQPGELFVLVKGEKY
jgi:hypothetical protein